MFFSRQIKRKHKGMNETKHVSHRFVLLLIFFSFYEMKIILRIYEKKTFFTRHGRHHGRTRSGMVGYGRSRSDTVMYGRARSAMVGT